MADEFKHKDVGDELSKPEYHGIDAHEADSQAAGDLIYCDGTYWKRVGKGANGLYLKAGSVPYWEAILDGDIPASIARDAEVDYKISAYAAPLIHHTRHELFGDDELDLFLSVLTLPLAVNAWRTRDNWTDYVTGSGQVTWSGILDLRCESGATSGSIASLYSGECMELSPQSTNCPFAACIQPRTYTTTSEIWVVARRTSVSPTSFPSLTEKHVGWRILNGALYASNGDGTNGIQTNTGVTINRYDNPKLLIRGTTGSDIKFYVDGVLKATHSTCIPTDWFYYCWCGIKNSAAVARTLRVITTSWGKII